jgi:hypothetical protein
LARRRYRYVRVMLPRRKRGAPKQEPPVSVRLSPAIKQFLKEEAKREQKETGGPPLRFHFMVTRAVQHWVDQRKREREEVELAKRALVVENQCATAADLSLTQPQSKSE